MLQLKDGDPGGFYFLQTRPLSYLVEGAPKDAQEFVSVVIVPSGQVQFYRSSSKIVTIDMAHMKSKTHGVICMPTVKDSKKALNSIIYSNFQAETKVAYEILYAVLSKLPPPNVIITDKHKGLHFMRESINGAAAAQMIERTSQDNVTMSDTTPRPRQQKNTGTMEAAKQRWLVLTQQMVEASANHYASMSDSACEELSLNILEAFKFYKECVSICNSDNEIDVAVSSESETREILVATCIVHMLCALHCGRNCGLTSELAKNLITKAARAPTEVSLQYYFQLLRENFPIKSCEYFEARRHEWSTVALFALGGHTNLGETNQNSSEQGHEADRFVRYLPITEGVMKWLLKKNEKRLTRLLEANAMLAVGRLVVPHATERTLSQGKYMSLSYEGKIIAFSDTVITIDVFRKDNIGVHYVVTLDSSRTHDTGSIVCECKYTEALGIPCYHGAFCLLNLRPLVDSYNRSVRTVDGKLPFSTLGGFSFLVPKWFHCNWHVDTYKAQYEHPIYLPTLGIHCSQFQLYPPNQKLPIGRSKKNRIKSSQEFKRALARKDSKAEVEDAPHAVVTMVRKCSLIFLTCMH